METYPITIGGVTRHVPLIEPLPGRRIPWWSFWGTRSWCGRRPRP
jgi:adenine phosphoribosyltransferase